MEKDCMHERRDTTEKEEVHVIRSRKRPSSRITRFSKQSYMQTLGKDV